MLTLAQAVTEALGSFGLQHDTLSNWARYDTHYLLATVISDVSSSFRADGQDQPYERDIIAELIRQIGEKLAK